VETVVFRRQRNKGYSKGFSWHHRPKPRHRGNKYVGRRPAFFRDNGQCGTRFYDSVRAMCKNCCIFKLSAVTRRFHYFLFSLNYFHKHSQCSTTCRCSWVGALYNTNLPADWMTSMLCGSWQENHIELDVNVASKITAQLRRSIFPLSLSIVGNLENGY